MTRHVLLILWTTCLVASVHAQPLGGMWGTAEAEAKFYRIVDLPFPESLAIEAGSFDALPDGRLAIGTRRGEIYLVSGAFDKRPELRFQLFASGLDEVFGLGYRDGAFYVTQQTEVTRITDLDGDGRADRFETLSDEWGFANYHEFSWGSRPDPDGNIWVVLGLSNSYHYRAKFRGWCMKVTPDGKTIPIASGIRSAGGIAPNERGVMFYAESQGPWNGSCSLKHLKPGGFMGHPISFDAYKFAPEMGPRPVEPNSGSRLHIEKKRVKQLVPYAVVFPYRKMGQSISGFRVDRTGGRFGPFENQIFVGDYTLSIVLRATTEKVNGVWQGACYPFREGLGTGILALQFSPNGSLVTGGTNRGWPVRGSRQYALERLDWTGEVPFEIERVSIRPDGFALTFTKAVDREVASRPEVYDISHYTHIYQKHYGSPEVDLGTLKVLDVELSADGRRANLKLDRLVEGHVHELDLPRMRSADGESLLHTKAYYTVNEIPATVVGDRSAEGAAKTARKKKIGSTTTCGACWMHMAHGHNNPAHFGLRTKRYKLIFFYGTDFTDVHAGRVVTRHGGNRFWKDTPAAWELYDLRKDPTEMHNRYGDPEYAAVVRQLKGELKALREEIGEDDSKYPRIQRVIDAHWND